MPKTAWEQGKHVFIEVTNDDVDDGTDEGKVFKEDTENLVNNDRYQ